MIKVCANCTREYWSRWRNTPTEYCPACRDGAVLCTKCGAAIVPPYDAAQLTLFPLYFGPIGPRVEREPSDYVWAFREHATQAEKRHSPYH